MSADKTFCHLVYLVYYLRLMPCEEVKLVIIRADLVNAICFANRFSRLTIKPLP